MNEIDTLLKKEVGTSKTPSVQYLLFDQHRILHQFHFGFAHIDTQTKVDAQTTYHAYSVTKTFTALSILQLAEQKKLDIEQPVSTYLPDFPYPSDITVRHLLTHTAGIPNPIPLSWIHLAGEHASFDRNLFFTHVLARNKKIKSKPNEKYLYSNLGYVLLGWIIENVSGLTYEEYITNHIIRKLEVQPGTIGFEITDTSKHATGYHKQTSFTNLLLGFFLNKRKYMDKAQGKWKPFKNFYVNGTPYGGLMGTPGAFATYIRELLKPGGSLLSDTYKKMLFTQNHTNDGKATGMCLSWFTGTLNGRRYFTHAGGGGGYYCEIRVYQDAGLGSVIFFNRTGMSDERFLDKVDRYYLTP